MKRADWKEKAARAAIRARERAELERLRLALLQAKAHRRDLLKAARAACKRARLSLRDKLRERRRLERERLKREALAARKAERGTCKARCTVAKRSGDAEVVRAAAALAESRLAQRRAAQQASRKVRPVERAARIHESDDAAKRDIPAELHQAWDRLKSRFKSGGRRSRAEAFLEWAEENPSEIVSIQQEYADREVARLVREHEAHQRKMRVRKTRAQIDEELRAAGVPF